MDGEFPFGKKVETPIGEVKIPEAGTGMYDLQCAACGESIGGGFLVEPIETFEKAVAFEKKWGEGVPCVWCNEIGGRNVVRLQ